MQLVLGILAAILSVIAAYFWWQGDRDSTFLLVVFAASAGFLSYRFHLKRRLASNQKIIAASGDAGVKESDH